jgi:ferrous-iron efflux pump FieF
MSGTHLAVSGALNSRAAMFSTSVALVLFALKTLAVWRTGSIAMLGSLADTGLDLIASLVTLIAVRVAAQPADYQHRFGHGKAEAIAALFQVGLIGVAALGIVLRSIERFGGAAEPSSPEYGIGVSLFAMALTLALLTYQAKVLRQTRSVAIQADNLHYKSDLALNSAVIVALILESWAQIRGADALFGLGIGLWLGWSAWQTASHAIDQLMDREWPLEKRAHFLSVIAHHPELQGIHDLRTRTSGAHDFVQFHIWVDPEMTVGHAHRLMDELEAKLRGAFPDLEILIHPDPVGHVDRSDPIGARDAQDVVADPKAAGK